MSASSATCAMCAIVMFAVAASAAATDKPKAVWAGMLFSDRYCTTEVAPDYCHELNGKAAPLAVPIDGKWQA